MKNHTEFDLSPGELLTLREAWLAALAARLAPVFAGLGAPLPDPIRIFCDRPIGDQTGRRRIAGECWEPSWQGSPGRYEIFIYSGLSDGCEAGAVLVHELVHAALHATHGAAVGHGPEFAELAGKMGLVGPVIATSPGTELTAYLSAFAAEIGPYPTRRAVKRRQGLLSFL